MKSRENVSEQDEWGGRVLLSVLLGMPTLLIAALAVTSVA